MNINRYNYEEFFLLYVDNELTKEERADVETFVQENPDLEEELLMLKQSSLRPDLNIKFPGKSSLIKAEAAGMVNDTNYEEFFLLYVDNELETVVRKEVEQFAATKPQYQQELNLLMEATLQPEAAVVFPDKSLLYKKEEDRKPVIIMWVRVAAIAAMLLVALGIFWISNRTATPGTGVAVKENKNNQAPVTKQDPQTINNVEAQDDKLATNREEPVNDQQLTGNDKENRKVKIELKKNEDREIDNIAYKPEYQPVDQTIETLTTPEARTIARVDDTKNNISTGEVNNASRTNTLKIVAAAYIPPAEMIEDDNVYIANTAVDKSKLRGIFRRVSRVFEKTTNLPAVEEKGNY
ncbi:MAG TPA: hypothetical protein VFZ47_06205 [Chitinophagaceae bacterium]